MDVRELLKETDRVGTGTVSLSQCTCDDCDGYTPQGKRWGVCEFKVNGQCKLTVQRNRKACAMFIYYKRGG